MSSYSEHIDNISRSMKVADWSRSLKDFLSDRTNGMIMLVGAIAIISSIVGFVVGARGFTINILGTMIAIVLSVLLSMMLIVRVAARERERHWKQVRLLTFSSIFSLSFIMSSKLFGHLAPLNRAPFRLLIDLIPSTPESLADTSGDELGEAMSTVVFELRRLGETAGRDPRLYEGVARLYRSLQADLEMLTHVLLPRVVQHTRDRELLSAVVKFSTMVMEIHHGLELVTSYSRERPGKRARQGLVMLSYLFEAYNGLFPAILADCRE